MATGRYRDAMPHEQATRDSRAAGQKAATVISVVLIGLGAMLGLVAVVLAFGRGLAGDATQNCLDVPSPAGYPPEGPVWAENTWWPLGTACEFAELPGAGTVISEQYLGPSWTALTGLGLVTLGLTAGVATATLSLRSNREDQGQKTLWA